MMSALYAVPIYEYVSACQGKSSTKLLRSPGVYRGVVQDDTRTSVSEPPIAIGDDQRHRPEHVKRSEAPVIVTQIPERASYLPFGTKLVLIATDEGEWHGRDIGYITD
jgi:hypothetical protein